ncbi:MAG: TMEM165/GDT1 family protein [Nitrososphaerota archaeon]|nr:TMEM165/GDT1 family protein [Nitrososphaerota archaeon]
MSVDFIGILSGGAAVFATFFAFELTDRTNFGVIGLAGKHDPRWVWTGAAMAFVVSTAIAIAIALTTETFFGGYLDYLKIAGGVVLVAFGLRTLLHQEEAVAKNAERSIEKADSRDSGLQSAFLLILFLEMGDNTQFLTIEFVWNGLASWQVIFLSASLALVSVAAIGASGGRYLKTKLSPERLETVMGSALVITGIATIVLAGLSLVA